MISAFGVEHDVVSKALKPQHIAAMERAVDQYGRAGTWAEHRLALRAVGPPRFKGRLGRKPIDQETIDWRKKAAHDVAADSPSPRYSRRYKRPLP